MKRLLCIVLCLVMTVFTLASCGEDVIGEFLENYPEIDTTVEELTLNICIIAGEGTTSIAKDTVRQKLTQYAKEDFNTILNFTFYTEAEYAEAVKSACKEDSKPRADIVLINSKELANSLVNDGLLVDLTDFYKTNDYGTLNVDITPTILSAAKINDKLYTVPNNHVVGQFEYVMMKKSAVRALYYSDEQIAGIDTAEEIEALRTALATAFPSEDINTLISVKNGGYAQIGADSAYLYNVLKKPVVTADDAHAGAFAIVKGTKDANRCMEIIYAFNTDSEYKNTLQYGVEGANYTIDSQTGVVTRVKTGDSVYNMNNLYTGNAFIAYPCEEIGWTSADITSGLLHNQSTVFEG